MLDQDAQGVWAAAVSSTWQQQGMGFQSWMVGCPSCKQCVKDDLGPENVAAKSANFAWRARHLAAQAGVLLLTPRS
eukprot:scaffold256654_cov18-Tisochrysis_lutea.AAC.3